MPTRSRVTFNYWLMLLAAWAAASVATASWAQSAAKPSGSPAERELLNSERIEQTFGSYGVEVLSSNAHLRVSNLYSEDPALPASERRTCRTFAVVRYPDAIDPAFAAEHAEILSGGSIGAVFAAHGWRVLKTHLEMTEVAASPRLTELMRLGGGTPLALHAYVLEISKDGKTLPYATLVEIHHPDYLALADVRRLYGPPSPAGREPLLAALRAATRTELAR